MRLALQSSAQLAHEPRFADPGLAGQQHDLPLAVLRLRPAAQEQRNLLLAADQGRQSGGMARLKPALRLALARDPPHGQRFGKTLEALRPEVVELEQAADQPPCRLADHDGAGYRQGLQAGGEVRRLADHRILVGGVLAHQIADHHLAGGDPHARLQMSLCSDRQPADRIRQLEPRSDRALGVVLVGPRPSEIGEHPSPR
jgi:hypothetical protein